MLFDLSGRRRHVVRVVYAILALLMGGSLFLAVGPFSISELINTGSTTSSTSALDDQAERIEAQLVKDPNNEGMLLNLARARITAGNTLLEVDPETGATTVTPEARAEFEQGLQTWSKYLKSAGGEPSPTMAQIASRAYFSLAETSASLPEIEENLKNAAAAQKVGAEAQPTVNSLSTLAIYEFFNGDFAAGDKAAKQAAKRAPSQASAKEIEKQMAAYRKRGSEWQKQRQKLAEEEHKRGREKLQNPLGGLGSGGSALAP